MKEIELRKNYLGDKPVETIYLGGGTPTLLSVDELKQVFEKLHQVFDLSKVKEITLEANPDDLQLSYIKQLKQLPINRLSIGIQSFNDVDLKWMNRSHNAKEAMECVKNCQMIGFNNLNIDLIYGLPKSISTSFKQNLQTFSELNINHLSAYCLTVEPKTALAHQIKQNKCTPLDESQAAEEMSYLIQYLKKHDFEQYEISNFAKAKQYAIHNTNYWNQVDYLGLGPSAHSFNGISRQWNMANNALYIKAIQETTSFYTEEILTRENRFNEYLMTALRTQWGIDLEYIEELFDGECITHIFNNLNRSNYEKNVHYSIDDNRIVLLNKGKLLADGFAANLFLAS